MSISGVFFTNKGLALQAKAQTGTPLHFTRIAIGDGELQGQAPQTFNKLVSEKLSIEITKLTTGEDGTAKVGGSFNNSNLETGFYYRELGLFARDPDNMEQEILYCYGNAGALADYIPAQGSELIEKKIDIIAIIGNATKVSATINSSLVSLSPEDLEMHDKDPEAHKPIRDWVQSLFNSVKHTWDGITGKPDTFPPSKHNHSKSEITDFAHNHDELYYTEDEVNNLLSGKANTSHGNHVPAVQTADNKKFLRNDNTWQVVTPSNIGAAPSSHVTDKSNPHGVTKSQVGLGNVQNYPVASVDEAKAGTRNDRYLTPMSLGSTIGTMYVPSNNLKHTLYNSTNNNTPDQMYLGKFEPKRDGIIKVYCKYQRTKATTKTSQGLLIVGAVKPASISDFAGYYPGASPFGQYQCNGELAPYFENKVAAGSSISTYPLDDALMSELSVPTAEGSIAERFVVIRVEKGIPLFFFSGKRGDKSTISLRTVQIFYNEVII